jgi:cyclopropane fatty-acyl-phospholipid synthase-like methyltransferase
MALFGERMGDLSWELEGPSELGIAAVKYLQASGLDKRALSILDIGCGNGRDAFYFCDNLACKVLGIDISMEAVDIATDRASKAQIKNVEFQCRSYTELKAGRYDIVFTASVYHSLNKEARQEFREVVKRSLKPKGTLFLSTLSIHDPEYYGRGTPVPDEPNSFRNGVYLHFSTREELVQDFSFVNMKALYEHEDYDPRVKGEINYTPWILVGQHD